MLVTYSIQKGQQPTPEQIAEIEAAQFCPIVFDEDSPDLTPEAREGFRRSAILRNRRMKGPADAAKTGQSVS